MPLRRTVLRGAPVHGQARVHVRLPGARRAGDPPQQPRRGLAEDTQDMSRPSRPSRPRPCVPTVSRQALRGTIPQMTTNEKYIY